jgi:hypothetical protein
MRGQGVVGGQSEVTLYAADVNNNQQKADRDRSSAATTMAAPDFTNTGISTLLENKVIKSYFGATLPLRLSDATLYRQSMPKDWVANHIFVALKKSMNELVRLEAGQTYVYCGKPKSRKSAAGAAIIKMALDKCFEHKVQNYP